MEISHEVKSKTVSICAIVRASRPTAHRARTAFKDVAGSIYQEMIADVAPALCVHVQILNAANSRLRGSVICRPISTACSVMNDGPIKIGHLTDAAYRSAGAPAGARADRRLRTLSCERGL